MKSGIHPESYRPVAFRDMSNGETFITRSTVNGQAEVGRLGWSCRQVHEPLRETYGKAEIIRRKHTEERGFAWLLPGEPFSFLPDADV